MKLPVIVVGAGGHAKVLIDALKLCSCEVIGIVDADPHKKGVHILGIPVIGNDEIVFSHNPDSVLLANGLGSVAKMSLRQRTFERFQLQGYHFTSVIHPSAVIASDVELAEGVQIMAGAVIQAGCKINANSIVNTRASVDHDCHIGAHVHIAPGVTLSGGVSVGDASHIGTGATVIQGVTIGKECLVAAGSVLLHDISEGITVMGVPARSKNL